MTRFLEDAVDAADDGTPISPPWEAKRTPVVPVGVVQEARVSGPGKQHGVLPVSPRVQPPKPSGPRRHKELVLNLTDEEYAAFKAMADAEEMPVSTWARLRVKEAVDLLKAGEGC